MSIRVIAQLVFASGLAFWMFLLQNLPFTFGDDLNVIHYAKQHSWTKLLADFINPLTPALYVHGVESLGSTRALEPILFKLIHTLFGYSPNAFWVLKSASVALTASFLFILIHKATAKKLIPGLAAIFFLLASPLFRGVGWMADLEITALMGNVLASYFFLELYLNPSKKRTVWFLGFLVMIASYWMGMKLKETGRLFPFAAVGLIIADQNVRIFAWLKKSRKNLFLMLTLVLLFVTVIPLSPSGSSILDERAQAATRQFNLGNLAMILWANPLTEHVPADLAHTFGWTLFLLGPILSVYAFAKFRHQIEMKYLLYFLIWFVLALLGTGLGFQLEGNERYLTVVLVPAVLLWFSILGLAANSKWVTIILAGLTFVTTQYNLDHIIFMRNFYGATNVADWKGTQIVFEDLHGKKPRWEDLDAFYRDTSDQFHEIRIKEWDKNVRSDIDSVKKVAEKLKSAYVFSLKENLYPGNLLAESDSSVGSLYSKLMSKIKKKAVRKIYVYKVSSPQSA